LSGLPFFSVRHGLRIVALHGSADPPHPLGGAAPFPFGVQMHPLNEAEARRMAEQIVGLAELVRIAEAIVPREA